MATAATKTTTAVLALVQSPAPGHSDTAPVLPPMQSTPVILTPTPIRGRHISLPAFFKDGYQDEHRSATHRPLPRPPSSARSVTIDCVPTAALTALPRSAVIEEEPMNYHCSLVRSPALRVLPAGRPVARRTQTENVLTNRVATAPPAETAADTTMPAVSPSPTASPTTTMSTINSATNQDGDKFAIMPNGSVRSLLAELDQKKIASTKSDSGEEDPFANISGDMGYSRPSGASKSASAEQPRKRAFSHSVARVVKETINEVVVAQELRRDLKHINKMMAESDPNRRPSKSAAVQLKDTVKPMWSKMAKSMRKTSKGDKERPSTLVVRTPFRIEDNADFRLSIAKDTESHL